MIGSGCRGWCYTSTMICSGCRGWYYTNTMICSGRKGWCYINRMICSVRMCQCYTNAMICSGRREEHLLRLQKKVFCWHEKFRKISKLFISREKHRNIHFTQTCIHDEIHILVKLNIFLQIFNTFAWICITLAVTVHSEATDLKRLLGHCYLNFKFQKFFLITQTVS